MRAPVQVLRGAGEELERRDRDLDLGGALPLRLAVVPALELGERIGLLVEQLRQPVQRAGPLGGRCLRPRTLERAARRGDGRVDVIGAALCDGRQLAAVGGVERGERSTVGGIAQLATDDELRGKVGHPFMVWAIIGSRRAASGLRPATGDRPR